MYKLVACDMDDTFLQSSCGVPEPNVRALARMKELGVLFAPCSGRAYNSIAANLETIDRSILDGTYIVSFNGGFIQRYGNPEPLVRCGLDFEAATRIYQHGLDQPVCIHVCFSDGTYNVFSPTEKERAYLAPYPSISYYEKSEHADIDFLESHDIVKVLYMSDDFAWLREFGETQRAFAHECGAEVTFSSNRYMEFMPTGVTKAGGLARLCDMLGIDISEAIALGDSENDISMLDAAGLGVGVANVTDEARAHCDAVLKTTGYDGALPELVERFLEP